MDKQYVFPCQKKTFDEKCEGCPLTIVCDKPKEVDANE